MWLPSHVQTYTQVHVPYVPFARRHSLIYIAFCHSTPVREAHIDRRSSLDWSIASFSVPMLLAVSHSATYPQHLRFPLVCFQEMFMPLQILYVRQSPHLIKFCHSLFLLPATLSNRADAGRQWTCVLYITKIVSMRRSSCSLTSICTASCSQLRDAEERLKGQIKPFISRWIEYRCCMTSLVLCRAVQ